MQIEDKDYLTTKEAAMYMCVGRTTFFKLREKYNIPTGKFGSNLLYRKSDLQNVIEQFAFKRRRNNNGINLSA